MKQLTAQCVPRSITLPITIIFSDNWIITRGGHLIKINRFIRIAAIDHSLSFFSFPIKFVHVEIIARIQCRLSIGGIGKRASKCRKSRSTMHYSLVYYV